MKDTFVYEPSFVCWVPNRPGEDPDDHEHDTALMCDWGWVCNVIGCSFRTDDVPCLDHAPTEVPALRLVECHTEPRHWIWVHRNDDHGHSCPSCWSNHLTAELEPLRHNARKREHRRCWLFNRAKHALVWLRVMRVSSWSSDCRYGMHVSARWRWTR